MKPLPFLRLTFLSFACGAVFAQNPPPSQPAFAFNGVSYWHRWSMNTQHEFTPAGQEDLEKWADMITVNVYPSVRDGDALAVAANGVLENYKSHGAKVLKTSSVPRTSDRPAEHFIAVVFGRPNFIEVAYARFRLADSTGCSIVYSHRLYGEKIGDQMSAWLKSNGIETEKALMEWKEMPDQKMTKLKLTNDESRSTQDSITLRLRAFSGLSSMIGGAAPRPIKRRLKS